MNWKTPLARVILKRYSLEEVEQIGTAALNERMDTMSQEERVSFLLHLLENHLAMTLEGLDRSHRVQLMNGLLPALARHFPLEELDILGTFSNIQGEQYDAEPTGT